MNKYNRFFLEDMNKNTINFDELGYYVEFNEELDRKVECYVLCSFLSFFMLFNFHDICEYVRKDRKNVVCKRKLNEMLCIMLENVFHCRKNKVNVMCNRNKNGALMLI